MQMFVITWMCNSIFVMFINCVSLPASTQGDHQCHLQGQEGQLPTECLPTLCGHQNQSVYSSTAVPKLGIATPCGVAGGDLIWGCRRISKILRIKYYIQLYISKKYTVCIYIYIYIYIQYQSKVWTHLLIQGIFFIFLFFSTL